MNDHVNPANPGRRAGGFTLVEVMMVVAILGVLIAMTLVAFDAMGRRGALQNVAFDLQGVLTTARAQASSRGHPVWVVVYTTASREDRLATTGQGAFALVEDPDGRFVRAPADLFALPIDKTSADVSATYFLEDYSKQVRFAALTPGQEGQYGPPFAALKVQTCSFCSVDAPVRGAIVFRADGSARFVDGQGEHKDGANQALALSTVDRTNQYLFAISGPSAYVATFSP
ncbi:prepilin-type N-terminal cleavage/methylation domain-containing protein [Archangium violaceum]|uniref:prepilin-type N-terminal cleavage/methylation domain-containing protein n=1 Tax=Archangium violaceum TaxID=83451 RepID=UPI00193C1620|nr:prepilin-type N-terminal cleavage/methylation domain-containing protein [Archangium violaceum]QRK08382.1 prepilin-type N-terminal cleavage/methylation domain-containing protein [Archangium violaceum]